MCGWQDEGDKGKQDIECFVYHVQRGIRSANVNTDDATADGV